MVIPGIFLGGRKIIATAELDAQARQAPLILEFIGEKFHAVQVDRPVTNFSANSNRFIGAWILELDLDMTSYCQVGCGKQANAAFT
jgi:hypothetical protein